MQTVTNGQHPGQSAVEMLGIIDLSPSDETCIYSSLVYAIQQAVSAKLPTPCITFDQPLYIKSVDISKKSNLNVVLKLGGFHTILSYLGSIGHLMKGSGFEEVQSVIFGSNTIEHVLSGKAYARAVRGHFIVHATLITCFGEYLLETVTMNV
jgi:hypothetical protein